MRLVFWAACFSCKLFLCRWIKSCSFLIKICIKIRVFFYLGPTRCLFKVYFVQYIYMALSRIQTFVELDVLFFYIVLLQKVTRKITVKKEKRGKIHPGRRRGLCDLIWVNCPDVSKALWPSLSRVPSWISYNKCSLESSSLYLLPAEAFALICGWKPCW